MVKMSSRVLALGTVATVAALATASAAFGAFSSTTIPGKSCGAYGYHAGYGYDCVDGPGGGSSSSSDNAGPGGVGGGYTTTNQTNQNIVLKPTVTQTVFKNFTKKCDTVVKDLSDSRLALYYNNLKVIDRSNINRPLTRAEFLKLVINSANIDVSNEPNAPFADVPASHPLNKYIAYAARIGQISATQGNNFYPDAPISRAEAAKVFVNAAGLGESTMATTFADVSFDKTQLAGYIQSAYDNCLLHGQMENGSRVYNPFRNISLGEAVKVIFNVNYQR
ncbi:MAG: S-layer homology domain-containing protein [Candidatus Altimarinota bacterium]